MELNKKADLQAEKPKLPVEKVYTCHPIDKLHLGGFKFVKSILRLSAPEDIERFDALLTSLETKAPATRAMVKTITRDAAVKALAGQLPRAIQGVVTSADQLEGKTAKLMQGLTPSAVPSVDSVEA